MVLDAVERLGVEPVLRRAQPRRVHRTDGDRRARLRRRRPARRRARRRDAGRRRRAPGHDGRGARARRRPGRDRLRARRQPTCGSPTSTRPARSSSPGSPTAVATAGAIAKELGAKKVMPLQGRGAFHTPFMTAGARPLAQGTRRSRRREHRRPGRLERRRTRATTQAAEWPSLLSAQLCSPVRWKHCAPHAADRGVTDVRRSSARARCSTGMAKRTRRGGRTISVATSGRPRQVARVGRSARRGAVAHHEGEHLFMTERLVVSPAAGLFTPIAALDAGRPIVAGDLLGHVGEAEVRSPFAGRMQSYIAHRRRTSDVAPTDRLAANRVSTTHHDLQAMRSAPRSPVGAPPCPTRSSPTTTSSRCSTRTTTGSSSAPASASGASAVRRRARRRVGRRPRSTCRASRRRTSTSSSSPPRRPTSRCQRPLPPCSTSSVSTAARST